MTVLAFTDKVSGKRGVEKVGRKRALACRSALLSIIGEHKLGESPFNVIVRVGRVRFSAQDGRIISICFTKQVVKNRIGYIMAGGTEVLALVIPTVKDLVLGSRISER
jgi:hypothetical protein